MASNITLTVIEGEGYIVEPKAEVLDFILMMDAKGWLTRHDHNRGRNFFIAGIERLDAFKKYCSDKFISVRTKPATEYSTKTYDDQCDHCYAFSNAPLNQKKDWCRIQIAKIDAVEFYNSPDGYYQAMDYRRKLTAALHDMTALEYDPMGVWFGSLSN